MDYKKKYLKYKFKYLQAKKTFKGGMETDPAYISEEENPDRIQEENPEQIMINLSIIEEQTNDIKINVRVNDIIYKTIKKAPGLSHVFVEKIMFDEEAIFDDDNYTFEDLGIEDGARLSVSYRKYTVAEVAAEVARLNPPLRVETLMEIVEVDPADPSRVDGILNWSKGIRVLPDSIGSLTVGGDLLLNRNRLASLPEGFSSLTVEGHLLLNNNLLASLPEGFGSLTVGRALYLQGNKLTSLPEGFGSLTVGGGLYLNSNSLASLPEGFGSLTVGGNLYLNNNQLTSLPESFADLRVGGKLDLRFNQLASLPDSFENVEGDVLK